MELDLEIITPPVIWVQSDFGAILRLRIPKQMWKTFTGYSKNSYYLLSVYYFIVTNNG